MGEKKRKGGLGIFLFGGIFASVGFGLLFLSVVPTLYEGWQMMKWQPVRAEVLEANLNTHRSDDSTTYSVSSSYRYSWGGRSYYGQRVGVYSGSDNIGDWHQQQYNILRNARDSGSTVTVWIDPQMPENAVVNRDIRWGLLAFELVFVFVFGGVGLGIIVFGLRKGAQPSPEDSKNPWLDNPAWRDNHIRSGGKAGLWILWIFGILWTLCMIPLWHQREALGGEGIPLSLLPYLLPLIGIAVLGQAIIKTLRRQRFNNTVLRLSPFPGQTGGRIAGDIDLKLSPAEAPEVAVRLSCIHVYWQRSGNKSQRREEVVWQDSQQLRVEHGRLGGRIHFDFRPQNGLPESSEGRDHYKWVVVVSAHLAGPDLDEHFTIPVFNTEEQVAEDGEGGNGATGKVTRQESGTGASAASLPDWLQLGYRAGGMTLRLPMFRNLSMALPLLLVGVIFSAVGLFISQAADAPLIFGLVFLLIGLGLFLGGLYSIGNRLEVTITRRSVDLTRHLFGIPFSRSIPSTAIRKLDKKIAAQAGSNAFYRVYVTDKRGRHITLADSLPSASAADYLIDQFGRQLHLG